MNKSIIEIIEHTTNPRARQFAEYLLDNRNSRIRVTFLGKNDGQEHTLVCVPNHSWKRLIGDNSPLDKSSEKMLRTKMLRDIVTVCVMKQGVGGYPQFEPRSIPLNNIISVERI